MFENQNVELRWKNVPSKAKAVLLVMFGVCLLNGCSNAQHQAKVDELNTDYCTKDVQGNCRYITVGFLTLMQQNDAFEEQLKPIHEREEVLEQELEVLRRKKHSNIRKIKAIYYPLQQLN